MQKLGQHFLQNQSVLRTIAESVDLSINPTIIEIGPGHGELTDELLALSFELLGKNTPTPHIIAIEKDERLASALVKKFPQVEIVTGDVLKILPLFVARLIPEVPSPQSSKLKAQSYSIVGNIPYYITGHLLRIIGELPVLPAQCVFTIQKEVALRVCSAPPNMNRLAASVQFWAKPEIIAIVPRGDFKPVPKVDSAIIALVTSDKRQATSEERDAYYDAVRVLFAQPRKTVLNNILAGDMRQATSDKKLDAFQLLEKAGINPESRPQDLSVEQIISLAKTI
jgi:16S rRNA (adenine1518-N6/adenine1519-N6)-dimethyltransferase